MLIALLAVLGAGPHQVAADVLMGANEVTQRLLGERRPVKGATPATRAGRAARS